LQIIPVIDLAGGQVVHARRGDRARYRALRSDLCDACEPRQVVEALLRLHAFTTLYIADLDAILRRGDNASSIESIGRHFPELELWVDAGLTGAAGIERARFTYANLRPVIGSESLSDLSLFHHPALICEAVLSLDFRGDAFLGPAELIHTPVLWPPRLIAMSLTRVGSQLGPDLGRLSQLTARAPAAAWYAAGGVRGPADLDALIKFGVAGALVATALHDGAIDAAALAQYAP
jgi:phosphoribosylformimino-5-aminoimidazole carboxamide ribotide isomerase